MPREIAPNISINAWNIPPARREQYEFEVYTILVIELMPSEVGRIVIESIQAIRARRMRIQPWTAQENNAEVMALDETGATARGEPLRDINYIPYPNEYGSGRGSSTIVRYSPALHIRDVSNAVPGSPVARVRWDRAEVLLHEMCHGLRQMLGVQTMRRMPHGLDNDEEFFAIIVTNIYSSQRNRPLGRDHADGVLPPGAAVTSSLNQQTVRRFRLQMPNLTKRLAGVRAAFNPFRDVPP